ncbi:DUF721 domain-containing protein [Mobilicoccus pelagius]|uniref:DUF721 domain-containing protein n=1 Tax=Mobilicoccus pelagius TaxID=746032 RepID=UPI0002ED0972|nr:DciA family protein [Mobilicoccus pelagius]
MDEAAPSAATRRPAGRAHLRVMPGRTAEATDEVAGRGASAVDASVRDSTPTAEHGGDPGAELDEDVLAQAAAAALARAREAARAKGLRPGSRPAPRRRRRTGAVFSGTSNDARDPQPLGDQLDHLLLDRGWKIDVAAGSVMGRWDVIVGLDIARHCRPVTFEDGVLTVRADSTAWATQLRLMVPAILARCATEAGPGVVSELRITGPAAPSWSRGPRRARGQGPRDTYG